MQQKSKYITKLKENSHLLKNISWVFTSSLIGNLLRFALVFIIIKFYSQEEFGLWASITSLAAVIVTGDFGFTNVLRNIVSIEIPRGEVGNQEAKQYFYSALLFFLVVSTIISIILLVFIDFIPYQSFFKTDNEIIKLQGRQIFIAIQFIFLFNIPLGLGVPLFFSYGESKYYSIIVTTQSIITFLLILLLSLFHCAIYILSISYFAINMVVSTLGTIIFLKKRGWLKNIFPLKTPIKRIKYMLRKGLQYLGVQLSSSFLQNILTIYAGALVGLNTAANINLIQKIFTFFTSVYQSVFNPIWSELAKKYINKQYTQCKQIVEKTTIITGVIYTLLIIFTTICGDYIVKFTATSEFQIEPRIFIMVGAFFMIKIIFDNLTLLQNATNQIHVIFLGYLIFDLFTIIFIPKITLLYGIDWLIISSIICWFIFCIIVFINFRKIVSKQEIN